MNAALAPINASIAAIQGDIGTLFDQNDRQDRRIGKANEGVAMALALDRPASRQERPLPSQAVSVGTEVRTRSRRRFPPRSTRI